MQQIKFVILVSNLTKYYLYLCFKFNRILFLFLLCFNTVFFNIFFFHENCSGNMSFKTANKPTLYFPNQTVGEDNRELLYYNRNSLEILRFLSLFLKTAQVQSYII